MACVRISACAAASGCSGSMKCTDCVMYSATISVFMSASALAHEQ